MIALSVLLAIIEKKNQKTIDIWCYWTGRRIMCDMYERRHCKEAYKISSGGRKYGESSFHAFLFGVCLKWQ